MVELSDVVGSIMRGLIESHAIADTVTLKTLESYRRHDVLSQVPVPRLAIREAHVSLRFAVAGVPTAEDGRPDRDDLLGLWTATMRQHVVPQVLRDVGRFDNKRVVDAIGRRLDSQDPAEFIDPELLGEDVPEERLIEASEKYVHVLVESLPPSTRKSLEATELSRSLHRVLREQVPDLRAAAKRLAEATRFGDLDVKVTADALASVPESQISQLDLTLGLEDIRFGSRPEGLDGTED